MTPTEALAAGLSIIPTGPDKRPILTTWKPLQTRRPTEAEFLAWTRLNPAAWAIVTGAVSGRVTLDFDGEDGRRTLEQLRLQPHRRTPSGGYHVDFRHPGWRVPTLNSRSKRELGARWPGLDIRADGGYVLFTGRTEKGEYTWLRDSEPYELDLLPESLRLFLHLLHAPLEQVTRGNGHHAVGQVTGNGRVDSETLVRRAVERVSRDGRNNSGFWLTTQLRDNGYSRTEAEGILRNFATRVPGTNTKGQAEPYSAAEAMASVREAYRLPAREPWERKRTQRSTRKEEPIPVPVIDIASQRPNLIGQPFNDFGNGQRLIAMYGDRMRYCHAFNSWLINDGKHWRIDRMDAARGLAQEAMLEFARQALSTGNEATAKFSAGCLNSQRITSAMREAQPHSAIGPEQLDTNPRLLNFLNGTVDLETGELLPHRREDFITKLVRHHYRPDAPCPRFRRFVQRVVGGLEDYIQKAIGYTLTGYTSEKAVFVCYGTGNNGKTTLLATLKEVLGDDYSVLLGIDTLMVRAESNNTQADLADLRGARFAVTSETEEGQRLAEGKLKRITQGMGKIKATRKYENPIEFAETHKLWVDCNHKPIVRGRDKAIWNRLHLIPFEVTIAPEEMDRGLSAKLVGEAEGILAWAVAGAVRWFREGLGKPEAVESAGQQWRNDMDQLGRFIEECCVTGDCAQAKARALYSAYRKWAGDAGEHAITETSFGNALNERKYSKNHTNIGAVYSGIGLAAEAGGR